MISISLLHNINELSSFKVYKKYFLCGRLDRNKPKSTFSEKVMSIFFKIYIDMYNKRA